MELGAAIKLLRSELGLTQTELAGALHISNATISRWELGKNVPLRPAAVALQELARSQGVSVESLERLRRALADASRKRPEVTDNLLAAVEHASLRQLIDNAPFTIYVCLMHRDTPCELCRKDDIEASAALWNAADATLAADIADRLFAVDYETVAIIDADTVDSRPYIGPRIDGVIDEQRGQEGNGGGVAEHLRKHCTDDDVEDVINRTSLSFVKKQLEYKPYYHTTYTLRHDDRLAYKRVMYTYLDKRRTILLRALQDLTDIHERENAKRKDIARSGQGKE